MGYDCYRIIKGVIAMTTEEYGLIDDGGHALVLIAIPQGDGGYTFELHGHCTIIASKHGVMSTPIPWLRYAGPITFLELCYTYYDGGEGDQRSPDRRKGTLRYPKLVASGKPVRVVTTTDMAGPTYKKVEYIHLELPPLLQSKPRLLADGYTCGSTHVVELQPGIYTAGGAYYDGVLYQCNRISPDSAYLSVEDSLSRAIGIT